MGSLLQMGAGGHPVETNSVGSQEVYTETGHGFVVGDVVVLTASGWEKAISSDATHGIKLGGVVSAVPGVDSFVATHKGVVSGYSGLTTGSPIYTHSTAGEVSAVPSNRAVGVAVSATQIFVEMGMPTSPRFIHIADEKAVSVDGGTFTSGARRIRTLNTVYNDGVGAVSLSSNVVTFEAGIYDFEIHAPAYGVGRHQAWLVNDSTDADLLVGQTALSSTSAQNDSIIHGQLRFQASTSVRVEHRCFSSQATFGLGVASDFGTEIYTVMRAYKKA